MWTLHLRIGLLIYPIFIDCLLYITSQRWMAQSIGIRWLWNLSDFNDDKIFIWNSTILSSSKDGLEMFVLTKQTCCGAASELLMLQRLPGEHKIYFSRHFHRIRFFNNPRNFWHYWSVFQELSHSTHFYICQNLRLKSGQETEGRWHFCCHYAETSQGQMLLPTLLSPSCLYFQMSDSSCSLG